MKPFHAIPILAVLSMFLFSCANAQEGNDSTLAQDAIIETVDVSTFQSHLADAGATLVDVRTDGEVAEGMIPGAIQIEYNSAEMEAQFNELDKSKPVLVYCAAGGRSGSTKAQLAEWGFQEVYDLDGGMGAWVASGMAVEQP